MSACTPQRPALAATAIPEDIKSHCFALVEQVGVEQLSLGLYVIRGDNMCAQDLYFHLSENGI